MNDGVLALKIRPNFYLDSVALMHISREVSRMPGVDEAALMIGTDGNKALLRNAGLFDSTGHDAGPNDLIIAIRAIDKSSGTAARAHAVELLDTPRSTVASGSAWRPKSLTAALENLAGANLALISVPGEFAAAEAHKALNSGLHVMLFSDNVDVADEIELKTRAREAGLLVMGPDCGSALIGDRCLGFANTVSRGDIGIVAASGTGLQELSCLVSRLGAGVSHAIGVGGRDLSSAVGGVMTEAALDALARDPGTRSIVVVSKPPDPGTLVTLLDTIEHTDKPVILCLIGAQPIEVPANVFQVETLAAAAYKATGMDAPKSATHPVVDTGERRLVGLFCGGTLCAEAQVVLRARGLVAASNAPIPGVPQWQPDWAGHTMLDLGADEFTIGRPHPMIDPTTRSEMLREVLADAGTSVVLIDIVLGYGAHADPAGEFVAAVSAESKAVPMVASVCGTEDDPQVYSEQVEKLETASVIVAPSNAEAADRAINALDPA